MLCSFLLAAGAVTLVFYVREKLREYSVKALILKSAVSTLFMLTALSALCKNHTVYGVLLVAGLLLGLLGDVWLDLKYVYPKDDRVYTYAGFISFLAGHIFFISAMISRYYDGAALMYVLVPAVLAVIVGLLIGVVGPKIGMNYGEFRTVSMVYGGVLFAMAFIAGGLALYHGFRTVTVNMMFIGGVLFAVSDLVLCGTYFAGKDGKKDIILNYITYYGAQFTIAMSILFA